MPNILTAQQAANALKVATNDARMLDLLPQIDAYIKRATGRDWAGDSPIHALAVSAATMLLVKWYEDPGALASADILHFGLDAALGQLEAEALKYRRMPEFYGLSAAGSISLPGALLGDSVVKLVGIYGVSGTQASKFESTISVADQIQQTAAEDLSAKVYLAFLKSPGDDITT